MFGLVSDTRGRDHGSMSATTTISSEQACTRRRFRRWEVADGYNIAHAFAYWDITSRVWALNDSQKM